MNSRIARYIILALLAVGAYALYMISVQNNIDTLHASGTIETTDIKVGSQVGGRVLDVPQSEGNTAHKGDVLVALDAYQLPEQQKALAAQVAQGQAELQKLQNGYLPEEVARTRAQYLEAKASYDLVKIGPRAEDIQQVIAARGQAQANYDLAKSNYDRFQTLYNGNVISQQELQTMQTNYQVAQEQLKSAQQHELELKNGSRTQEVQAAQERMAQAQAQYKLMQRGARQEDIAAQRDMVKNLQAQLTEVNKSIHETQVKAPCQCQISSLNIKPGQLILPSQTVATLINLDDLWVRVYIPEEAFGRFKIGDMVTLKVDAFGNTLFKGKIVQLGSRAEYTPRNVQTERSRRMQVFGIKIALDNTDRKLRPGMIADVTLEAHHQ